MSPPNKNDPPVPDTLVFNLGDIVRKKVRPDEAGMITGLIYRVGGGIQIIVSWSGNVEEQIHYEAELKLDSEYIEKAN